MTPVISWPGGKRRLVKHILPLIPEHTCYVEPFGAGLAVLCAKARARVEVVNDIDGDLVSFYRCVRFHIDELLKELEFLPNSRREFADALNQPGLTDIQRAARWFAINKLSFGGKGGHYGAPTKHGGAANTSREYKMLAIRNLNKRLDRVNIECLDWRRIFDIYDRPYTFFYIDPPYTSGFQFRHPFTEEDHAELRERIGALKGKWLLSYDDSEAVRKLYEGMTITEVSRPAGIGNNLGRSRATAYREVLIRPAQT